MLRLSIGRPPALMKWYLFEYEYGGCFWSFEIMAKDPEEAKERVESMRAAVFMGEVFSILSIPQDAMPLYGERPELAGIH